MSRYRIVYEHDGAASLLETYQFAADPAAVAAALDRIEAHLSERPLNNVQTLREGLYALNEAPLRVVFEVREAARAVHLAAFRLLPGHAGWRRPGGRESSP